MQTNGWGIYGVRQNTKICQHVKNIKRDRTANFLPKMGIWTGVLKNILLPYLMICLPVLSLKILLWRHNGRGSVSNHQPHHCLLNRLFRRRSKKTSKLRVTGLCARNSPETGEFPTQRANKQRVLMHRHQGWNVRHGLCHIYMRYLYIYELFIAFVCFVVCSLL